MVTKEVIEEHNLEQLITLLKKVKVTSSFVEKLEKESGYLEFQQEVELKRQELLKSKQAGKETAEQSPCCIKFLQELLKINADLSEEELISLTSFFKVKLQRSCTPYDHS